MSQPTDDDSTDDDQPLNFGSDLSIKACMGNCLEGECCDCDYNRPEFDDSGGQPASTPYQQPTAHESLQSIVSSGQGPSQPRPIVQQYQETKPMHYGSSSYAGRGNTTNYGPHPESYAGHPSSYAGYPVNQAGNFANYGGVSIAPQYPHGFSTQGSSYQENREVTRLQESWGWFRDGTGRLCNGRGEHIDDRGEVIQSAASSMPQSSGASGDGDFRSAPSHRSDPSGGSPRAGLHNGHHHGKKHKYH